MARISWSHSRLVDYETCPFRFKLKYLDKIPEPARPLKPGQLEQPNDRGTRIHKAADKFVSSNGELVPEMKSFEEEFNELREYYSRGLVSLEQELGYDENWEPCGYYADNTWLRVKLDAFVRVTPTQALAIDYKTGKKAGNEIKHAEQLALYQLASFMRYPELEEVHVELWYLDQNDLTYGLYNRTTGMRHLAKFNKRAMLLSEATEWPPNPNIYNCRFCQYGPKGSKVCQVGI